MNSIKNSLFEVKGYKVKKMKVEENLKDLLKLCEECLDYYKLIGIKSVNLDTAKEVFEELPPGKEDESKMVIGVYNNKDTLIGIIEGIRDFPKKDIWYIGQMMISKNYRNRGLGEKFYKGFEELALMNNVNSINLGVLKDNIKGLRFWNKMGFVVIERIENYKIGNIETTVFRMENSIIKNMDKYPKSVK